MPAGESTSIRHAVLLGAIGLAVYAQFRIHAQRDDEYAWLLLGLAALFAAVFAGAESEPARPPEPTPTRSGIARRLLQLLMGALALAAIVGATVVSSTRGQPLLALGLWLASGPLATVAVLGWRITPPRRGAPPWSAAEIGVLIGLVVLAGLARALWIDQLPRTYFGDEPRVAMYLQQAYSGGRIPNFFSMGWNTWPVIGLSLQGLFVPVLGNTMSAVRLSSALMGTLGVLATYVLARHLGGVRLAVLAAIVLTVCRTAIDFGRLGITHAQILFIEPLAFACLWRAIDSGRATAYLWAGIATGWCLYSYNAGQLVPALVFGWFVLGALRHPGLIRTHWAGVLLCAAAFVLTIFPYVYFFTDHFSFGPNWDQWTIMARNRQTIGRVADAFQAGGFEPAWNVLRNQVWLTWLGFGVLPGGNYVLGYRRGGMLDDVSAALFFLGLAISIRRIWQGRDAFAPFWWLATVVAGGIMTADPPAVVRMVGILPALAILAAIPLDGVAGSALPGIGRPLAAAAVAAVLGLATWENWRTYFVEYANERGEAISELARYARDLPEGQRLALVGAEHYITTHNELFILEVGPKAFNVPDAAHVLPWRMPASGPLVLGLSPTQTSLAAYAAALYPGATITDKDASGAPLQLFRAVSVPLEDLAKRSGLTLSAERAGAAPVVVGTADPFAAPPEAAAGAQRLVWTGSIYWPTHRTVPVTVDGGQPTTVQIGAAPPIAIGGRAPVTGSVTLPRGWQPLRIEEQVEGRHSLVIKMPYEQPGGAFTRWQLRPDVTDEGLSATYRKPDGTVIEVIDPLLDALEVEDRNPIGSEPFITMPFTVSWRGALRVDSPGEYVFEAAGSGPYRVILDGVPLFSAAVPVPEQPVTSQAKRRLEPGLHPIQVEWDSTRPAHTTRRLFQLFWKPPGGDMVLIPPTNFVRTAPPPPSES